MMNAINNFYLTMMAKMVETGDLFYWTKNYGEYWRLVMSDPWTATMQIAPLVIMVILIIITVVICVKLFKWINKLTPEL